MARKTSDDRFLGTVVKAVAHDDFWCLDGEHVDLELTYSDGRVLMIHGGWGDDTYFTVEEVSGQRH